MPKTKSKLRIAFNPGDAAEGEEDNHVPITKPARLGLSSTSKALPRFDQDTEIERPSYTKSTLDELRNSTPSTPKELTTYDPTSTDITNANTSLDIASKFGSSSTISNTHSLIPSAAEIQEKKDRRARLALQSRAEEKHPNNQEQDFISLESYDSDGEFKPTRLQLSTFSAPSSHQKQTRLNPDDEDLLEGFETFTEDPGLVTLNTKAQKAQNRQEKEKIRTLIEEASLSSESDSETEQNHAYESAQTNHGLDGLASHSSQKRQASRPRQPKEITPIPKLAVALGRLRDAVARIEIERVKVERRRADVRKERAEIKASQDHIQRSLEEAGRELALLQEREREEKERERGNGSGSGNGGNPDMSGSAAAVAPTMSSGYFTSTLSSGLSDRGRGLESFGNTDTRNT